jgi:D-serine deaminase-like pyridoxal phosphate-dependent protein
MLLRTSGQQIQGGTVAERPEPSDGLAPDDIPTPAVIVDAAVVRRNIDRLARYADSHKLGIRPHTKTHKSRHVAALQVAAGAIGLTAAKVGEAEVMADVHSDILLAYPAVDPARTRRLAALAKQATIRVAVDTPVAVERIAAAAREAGVKLGLLVDMDVGMGRTGVSGAAPALTLAQLIDRTDGVRLDGLFCYPGHIWNPKAEQNEPLQVVAALLEESLDLWRRHGLATGIVSGGSTPTAYRSHLIPQLTEIRPGTYVFNDMNTVRGGFCELDDCAARIVCTVISDAVPEQVVIDAGTKTLTSDACIPDRQSGHGLVVGYPGAKVTKLSEEHGQVDVSGCDRRPRVGDQVEVIPNHICPCVNLQSAIWWLAEGSAVRMPVDARGLLS